MNPPPLPAGATKQSIFHQAAIAGLAAPLIAIVARVGLESLQSNQEVGRLIGILIGVFAVLMILLGLVFSVVALCGIPSQGKQRLLGFGLTGAIINGLLLSLFVVGFVGGFSKAVANRKALQQLTTAGDEAATNMAKAYDPASGIDPDAGLKGMSDYRTKLDSASKNMSGKDAQAAQAMAACVAKWEQAQEVFNQTVNSVDFAAIMEFGTLHAKGQIDQRRQTVQKLIEANETLRASVSRQENDLETELRSRPIPVAMRNEIMVGFRKSHDAILPKVVAIRDCDVKCCQAIQKLLDLADSEWGRWRYDAVRGQVTFDETVAAETFNQLHKQIESLAKKEVQLQGEAVKIQMQRPAAQSI